MRPLLDKLLEVGENLRFEALHDHSVSRSTYLFTQGGHNDPIYADVVFIVEL